MKFLAMHITNQKLSLWLDIDHEHDLNILMIFGIKEMLIILTIQCIVGYCSCDSVVEHCVSSAKGRGFDSQRTHILTKKCIA